MNDRDRDLFVDSSSGTSTTITAPPALGHIRYTCNQCGRDWEYGSASCSKCGSIIFDAVEVPPTLLQRVGSKFLGIETAKPVVIKPLTADDIAVFERAAHAGREFASALQAADQRAREIVNSDRASGSMAFLQGKLDAISSMVGDFAPSNMGVSLAKPAMAVADFVDQQLRQHQTEVTT